MMIDSGLWITCLWR